MAINREGLPAMATILQPTLSRAEWHAVSIALHDADQHACASSQKPGFLGWLYTAITGNEPQRPLADPRLESIRRFVCAMRRKPDVAETLIPELEAQGLTRAQVEALALLSR
jgi:hypothetical protein